MKKRMKKSPCGKVRLGVLFVVNEKDTDGLRGELEKLTSIVEKIALDGLCGWGARKMFWGDEWRVNYFGELVCGGQWALYAGDKQLEEIKKKIRADVRVLRRGSGIEMTVAFGVVKKWDREWQKLH